MRLYSHLKAEPETWGCSGSEILHSSTMKRAYNDERSSRERKVANKLTMHEQDINVVDELAVDQQYRCEWRDTGRGHQAVSLCVA